MIMLGVFLYLFFLSLQSVQFINCYLIRLVYWMWICVDRVYQGCSMWKIRTYTSVHKGEFITGRNEVVSKDIFLHLSVIHSVHRGGSASMHAGIPPGPDTPPPEQTPPRTRHPPPPRSRHPHPRADPLGADTPQEQTPPGSRHPPVGADTPPPESRLQHTVYERPVRILLECILVANFSSQEYKATNLFCAKALFAPVQDAFSCSWVPVYVDKDQTLAVMSIAFLLNKKDDAVVWRGPKKTGNLYFVKCYLDS